MKALAFSQEVPFFWSFQGVFPRGFSKGSFQGVFPRGLSKMSFQGVFPKGLSLHCDIIDFITQMLSFYRPVRTLGTSLVTISGAYPRRGCATETMTALIILTKINKIAQHPPAHPVISDVQLDGAFQIPSDVMETTIVATVLVRLFF